MSRPNKFPEWASSTVVDPNTGQPNKLEPPEAKKDSGWDAGEFPSRNFMNWLQNLFYQWIVWFDSLLFKHVDESDDTNGYVTLPNGTIMQWGEYTGSSNDPTIAFPIAFQSFVGTIVMTSSESTPKIISTHTTSLTDFVASGLDSTGSAVPPKGRWYAVGR